MPSLNIDFGFPDHIKTRRLAGLLGGNAEAEGLLVRLWCHVGGHHGETGRLPSYTPQEIEAIVRWMGEPGKFVEALCKVGYLHRDPDGFRLHDWSEHQGHIGALKARAKAAADVRWGKIRGNAPGNAPRNAPRKAKLVRKQSSYPSVPSKPPIPTEPSGTTTDSGACAPATPTDAVSVVDVVEDKSKPLHVEFVDRFKTSYEAMTGQPYKADQHHFVIAHSLISKYGYDTVVGKAKLLGAFCRAAVADPQRAAWFTKGGWSDFTIEKLSSQWNSIIPDRREDPETRKQREFLEEMQKKETERATANSHLRR